MPLSDKTSIVFTETETSVRAEINIKRNDPNLNVHNRLISQSWRANVDLQLILDITSAINYIVKYASKGEKASRSLVSIYNEVMNNARDEEDPNTKLRSLMIHSVAGKRDLGSGEISRYLLSEPSYHSDFESVNLNLNLDIREIDIETLNQNNSQNENNDNENNTTAFKKSLIDYYANRFNIDSLKNCLDEIFHLCEFVRLFKIYKNQLVRRNNPDRIVVITFPKVRPNKDNLVKHKEFCYYMCIKFTPWTIDDLENIKDKSTACERWKTFLETAPQHIMNTVKFSTQLSKRLREIRDEGYDIGPEPEMTREHWMIASEMLPNNFVEDEFTPFINLNYDWLAHLNNYTNDQIEAMNDWIHIKKIESGHTNNNEIPIVLPEQLNRLQRFAYNLVEYHFKSNLQLLLILNGTAGSGKSFTIYAISNYLKENVKRAAPTGKAAYLIKGKTLHTLFNLKAEKSEAKTYFPLKGDALIELQEEFKGIEF